MSRHSDIRKILVIMILTVISLTSALAQNESRFGIHFYGGYSSDDSVSSNIGTNNKAKGLNSFAGGLNSFTTGDQSFAFGENDTVTGSNSVAMGKLSRAMGQYSFAQGYHSVSTGNGSIVMGIENQAYGWCGVGIGYRNKAHGLASFALGSNVYSIRDYAISIGSGINSDAPLVNYEEGIMLGVNSVNPTLFITKSPNDGKVEKERTGKVSIGATVPEAKLHVLSDLDEDADILLEARDKKTNSACIRFQDAGHSISVGADNKMRISARGNGIHFVSDRCCFNSESTFIRNEKDETFLISSPKKMEMESGSIMLAGRVGVNTENHNGDYAMAVNGGIITTEVLIKDIDEWPDYVFDDGYHSLSLHELERYIRTNRHLPDIPSQEEVMTNGFDVATMAVLLLRKIEELTLYTIDLQNQIAEQQQIIDRLKCDGK